MQTKQRIDEIESALKSEGDQYLDFLANKEKIERILELQEKKDVLILGHNYMIPLVYQLTGQQYRGDSLGLSREAAKAKNQIILFNGVVFMAETAKILNPEKKVLISDLEAGCSLADPFRAKDVLEYKARFPRIPVVTYINSYADVKAETDYCCTSANALKVVEHAAKEFGVDRVIFLPDSFMGKNIEDEFNLEGKKIDVIYPGKYDKNFGRCEVHEKFTLEMIIDIRKQFNMPKNATSTAVLAHWECRSEVLREADFYGSTTGMGRYLKAHPELKKVYLATECEMAANLASEFPNIEFVRACSIFCQHMRKITLDKILHGLENEVYEVFVEESIRRKALVSIERMLALK